MVVSAGSPIAKASVTFTVTKANGTVVTAAASTGTNGAAIYKVRLKPQDPPGRYDVEAAVTKGAPAANASTSFVVQ